MLIPHAMLEADTLTRLIEDFVTREMSASGVVIGCNWNFSTKMLNTLLDKNFGKDGPM